MIPNSFRLIRARRALATPPVSLVRPGLLVANHTHLERLARAFGTRRMASGER